MIGATENRPLNRLKIGLKLVAKTIDKCLELWYYKSVGS
jgi:hypothetical protein